MAASRSRRIATVIIALLAVAATAGFVMWRRGPAEPTVETAEVRRGNYTDVVEIRGDVRPVKSTVIMAPANAGELVILKLAKNGAPVKKGDIVAEFDAVTLRRTIQDKQGELRTVLAELDQSKVTSGNQLKERESAVIRAQYDVDRARLALGNIELVAAVEAQRNKLALLDAEQKLKEAKAAVESTKAGIEADARARDRRIAKVKADLERAQNAVAALQVAAPVDGIVNIMPNNRFFTPSGPQEFRPGDRTYPGAGVLELPDLSGVFLVARVDEADRGAIRAGQKASVRADAVAERDYTGTVTEISILARADFASWPPTKMFDLKISLDTPDDRLRPGMSAVARIGVGSVDNVLLVPAGAVFRVGGRDVVYRFRSGAFEAVPVQVVRRGREEAALASGVNPGDRIALTNPEPAPEEGK
jgi:multidrug efflux pump subunit AcrA (membrane-fusion protein)